ncbi:hypothetical protein HK097_002943 [Rhizophlyctis rosea]|uniref:histidine kinase n=1 Tax=Rhizophlyctis rosea TaxID=64517 RepID=A0AAD5X6E1_9FUNG|nr:hypothetical protein HK097_002943 [Rhizophlyctis rosea]
MVHQTQTTAVLESERPDDASQSTITSLPTPTVAAAAESPEVGATTSIPETATDAASASPESSTDSVPQPPPSSKTPIPPPETRTEVLENFFKFCPVFMTIIDMAEWTVDNDTREEVPRWLTDSTHADHAMVTVTAEAAALLKALPESEVAPRFKFSPVPEPEGVDPFPTVVGVTKDAGAESKPAGLDDVVIRGIPIDTTGPLDRSSEAEPASPSPSPPRPSPGPSSIADTCAAELRTRSSKHYDYRGVHFNACALACYDVKDEKEVLYRWAVRDFGREESRIDFAARQMIKSKMGGGGFVTWEMDYDDIPSGPTTGASAQFPARAITCGAMYMGRSPCGKYERYMLTLRDVSEEKKMLHRLKESEKRLGVVIEATNDGVWEFWPQTGERRFSRGFTRMLGYEPDEYAHIHSTAHSYIITEIHPADRDNVLTFTKEMTAGRLQSDTFEIERRMLTKSGNYLWLLNRGRVLERDAEGKPTHIIGAHIDLTTRKDAELFLARQNLLLDEKNRLLDEKNAQLAKSYAELEKVNEEVALKNHLLDERNRELDEKNRELDAALRVLDERNRMLDGALQEAGEASRSKGEWMANMSHEIRTPLNGIIGLSDVLWETSLTDDQKDLLKSIRECSDGLLLIVNDVLDFSKIEAGKLSLERRPFHLARCIRSATSLLAMKAAEKGLELRTEVLEGTPEWVVGDYNRLRQVLLNIVGNAVKFTERGEVVVEVGVGGAKAEEAGQAALCKDDVTTGTGLKRIGSATSFIWTATASSSPPTTPPLPPPDQITVTSLQFRIRDTGVGISPAALTRLFQKFTQADASTSRKYGGTGLGLAISKHLVEIMDVGGQGGIDVSSEVGVGSEFLVKFCAEVWERSKEEESGDEGDEKLEMKSTKDGNEALNGSGMKKDKKEKLKLAEKVPLRILVAEDNLINQKLTRRLLFSLGYDCDMVENGVEAVNAVRAGRYELVLMDVQMPIMSGLEATKVIREEGLGKAAANSEHNSVDWFQPVIIGKYRIHTFPVH